MVLKYDEFMDLEMGQKTSSQMVKLSFRLIWIYAVGQVGSLDALKIDVIFRE